MTFMEGAGAIADNKYLRRLVDDIHVRGNTVGDFSEPDEVEEMVICVLR